MTKRPTGKTSISQPISPRKRRKEDRPGEIIEAALAEFAAVGFAAARLEDVARRAGVVKGTIYRYFDDKEALFFAAVRQFASPKFDLLEQLVDDYSGSTRDLLRTLIGFIHANLAKGDLEVIVRIILTEGRNFPQLTELYHKEVISRGQAALGRIVARGVERGEVRAGAAAELPIVILSPAIMMAVWNMTFDRYNPIAPERFLRAHLDLVLNGFLVPDSEKADDAAG